MILFKNSFSHQLLTNAHREKIILNLYRNILKLSTKLKTYDEIIANYVRIKAIEEFDRYKKETDQKMILNIIRKGENHKKDLEHALKSFQTKNFHDKILKKIIMSAYGCGFENNRFLGYWKIKDVQTYKNLQNPLKKGFLFNFPIPLEFSNFLASKPKEEQQAYKCLEEPNFDEFLED
jgi:hypothetical protein